MLVVGCRVRGGGDAVPRDLLHDVADKSSALAEVTLGARDTGLDLARGDFLFVAHVLVYALAVLPLPSQMLGEFRHDLGVCGSGARTQ